MRISDWSSDVCSSDLHFAAHALHRRASVIGGDAGQQRDDFHVVALAQCVQRPRRVLAAAPAQQDRLAVGNVRPTRHRAVPTHCRRSEEHTSELQSLMRISYAVFCLKKKKTKKTVRSRAAQLITHTQ